jgi:hypothetical protein
MPETLKSYLRGRIAIGRDRYLDDLQAMSGEQLGQTLGGKARTAYDFTYEVAHVNRRIAKRMRGEDPGPANMDSWLTAPLEFKSRAEAIRQIRESSNEILSAFDAIPEGELERAIPLAKGQTSPLDLATLAAVHMSYHDAQLNFIQAALGDDEVHWMGDE